MPATRNRRRGKFILFSVRCASGTLLCCEAAWFHLKSQTKNRLPGESMDASLLKETEFAQTTHEKWVKLAQKALKGADFNETLVSRTDDNIAVGPLYQRASKAQLTPRKNPSQVWHIVQRIDDPD